jgi:hypothetical protein
MSNSRNEELAWAAGFLDGEMHIGTTRTGKGDNKRLHLVVCQVEKGPLERLQGILGVGGIYGPYNIGRTNRQPYKQFHITKAVEVKSVIKMVWPWLSEPKRKQAIEAFSAYDNRALHKPGPKSKPRPIPNCHPDRPFKAKGMCNACYRQALKSRSMNGN